MPSNQHQNIMQIEAKQKTTPSTATAEKGDIEMA
jgi:hypothetical protein